MALLLLAACEKVSIDDLNKEDPEERNDGVKLTFRVMSFEQTRFNDPTTVTRAAVRDVCDKINLALYDMENNRLKAVNQKAKNGARNEQIQGAYELYQKAKQLDLYSYPTEYDAYEGTLERTNPAYTYRLEIGDKVINATNCPLTNRLPEGLTPKGRSFLTLVFEIIDTIQNSDEWKSLPEQTPRYE